MFDVHAKQTETKGKMFLKNFHFKSGWTDKKDKNKAGMRKLDTTTNLLWKDGGLLPGLQCNALASLVYSVVYKVN